MSRAAAARRRRSLLILLASAALALPAAAAAEDVAGQDTTRDRTGPRSEPPSLPDYPQPEELQPLTPPAPPEPPSAIPPAVAGLTIREVRVTAEGEAPDAVPPLTWMPPADAQSGLRIAHQPGQPLDPDWVRSQFAANFGPEGASASRAVALVQLLNRAFLTAGFVNSGIVVPPQSALGEGILELRLIYGRLVPAEGAVEAVTVEFGGGGSAGLDADYVRRRFPSIQRRPLSALEIERDFRLLAEDPAIRSVNADLRPSTTPGEASLNLIVFPEERFDFYVGAANDRSPSVGGERLYAGGYVRNLLAGGDILTGEAGLTEGVEDVQVGYSVPVFTPRTTLSLRGSYNDAAVIEPSLVPLDISARDRSVEAGLSHRFVQEPLTPREDGGWSPSRTLSGGVLVAWRRQKSFLLGQPFSFAPGSVDGVAEYTALRLTGDYLMRGVEQVLAVSVTGTIGLGGTQTNIPTIPNPDDHFQAILGQLNYARRLDESGLELRSRLTGQLAAGVLYSGERLSIGGEFSVRGYRENLFLVDNGLTGSVELALPFSLSGREAATQEVDWGAFTASVFADGAVFENVEAIDPEESWLGSVGLSLAWNPSDAILVRGTYGLALNEITLSGSRDIQDDGFQFRIVVYPLRLFR